MTYDEVANKFRENAEFARFPKQKAEEVVAMVRELESLPKIGTLMETLAHDRA
jgi:hypothetical protein